MSNKFASFAPYDKTPPPDDPTYASTVPVNAPIRPWFPSHASSAHEIDSSYQSGGIPTFGTSVAGGGGSAEISEAQTNQWETRYGMRVDILAAAAYLLGPITALGLLILETQNDFVRFHAYQSALLTTPLLAIRIFVSLIQAPSWIQTLCTMMLIIPPAYMAARTYMDATRAQPVHYHLPIIGSMADGWLADE
ncbi:hypothetical protein D9615_010066 [Tricholomella constricta]|uniref:Uncharacterized protein n=1 Tax=Tricholomella constricta TaxID=117010 RepID=A0A8H5GSW6_9AGAR|nr:hypothetical protein D9615_010066 [Tricholomella constricta]